MKKKFKDTKFGSILIGATKNIGGGALNVLTGGVAGTVLDFNKDGKVDLKDIKSLTWQQWIAMASSVGVLSYLVSKEVIDLDKLIEVIKAILPLIS